MEGKWAVHFFFLLVASAMIAIKGVNPVAKEEYRIETACPLLHTSPYQTPPFLQGVPTAHPLYVVAIILILAIFTHEI